MNRTPSSMRVAFGLICIFLGGCQLPENATATALPTLTATALPPSDTPTATLLPPTPKIAGQIAYLATDPKCCSPADLYILNLDGSGDYRLFTNVFSYTWSPKGDAMLINGNPLGEGKLFILKMDRSPSYEWSYGAYPAWSPDGTTIAYEDRVFGQWGIYTRSIAGSAEAKKIVSTTMGGSNLSWSPDGTQLAFIDSQPGQTKTLNVIQSDGTGMRTLADSVSDMSSLKWSPDGKQIAFERWVEKQEEVFVIQADGANLVRLTTSPGIDSEAAWSPDGTRIAFVSFRDGDRGGIFIMNKDGSNQYRLIQSNGLDNSPIWSPDGRYLVFSSKRDSNKNSELYLTEAIKDAPVYQITNNPLSKGRISWRPQ